QAGLYALKLQARGQQQCGSTSPSTLVREFQSGRDLSCCCQHMKLRPQNRDGRLKHANHRNLGNKPRLNGMDYAHLIFLLLAVGVIAFLYSSVGHAGASGYIAIMTLGGIAPAIIRPTALVLNILVASIGALQFWRAGHFAWKLFLPFAVLFLPRCVVFRRWGHLRQAAAFSALFILVNSLSGLAGYFTAKHSIPSLGIFLAAAAIVGGLIGSNLGSRHFPARIISLMLATVLMVAGMKLIFTN